MNEGGRRGGRELNEPVGMLVGVAIGHGTRLRRLPPSVGWNTVSSHFTLSSRRGIYQPSFVVAVHILHAAAVTSGHRYSFFSPFFPHFFLFVYRVSPTPGRTGFCAVDGSFRPSWIAAGFDRVWRRFTARWPSNYIINNPLLESTVPNDALLMASLGPHNAPRDWSSHKESACVRKKTDLKLGCRPLPGVLLLLLLLLVVEEKKRDQMNGHSL